MGIFVHREQIFETHRHWNHKPSLRMAYHGFYRLIASHLSNLPQCKIVELGSGIGSIKEVIPECLTTDMFVTPWSEQVENAYHLSFADGSVSDLIMLDVFHHLQYPGTALAEFHRVLQPGGRLLLFEPHISLLGQLVYGLLHSEGLRRNHKIQWIAPSEADLQTPEYYTSQGNATRIFQSQGFRPKLQDWKKVEVIRLSAISYLGTGGYSKPQLVPDRLMPILRMSEKLFSLMPGLFATRMLVVLTA